MARFKQDDEGYGTDELDQAWRQADAALNPTPAPTAPNPPPTDVATSSSGWTENNPFEPPITPQPLPGHLTGGAGDYTQDLGPAAGGTSGGGSISSPGMPMSAFDSANSYRSYLDQIAGAKDPREQLMARDGLARQLQQDLEADGHTIKWNGDTLMIDGRAYELGNGGGSGNREIDPTPLTGANAPAPPKRSPTYAGWLDPFNPPTPDDVYYDAWLEGTGQTGMPPGRGTQLNADNSSRAKPTTKTGGGAQPTAAYLQSLIASGMDPQAAIQKFNQETGRQTGNEAKYYGPEVHGKPTIGLPDAYLSLEDDGQWHVTPRGAEGAGGGGAAGRGGRGGAVGNNYDFNALWDSMPDFLKNWSPSAAGYAPDAIDTKLDELPGFDEIYKLLSKEDPEEAKLSGLVNNILEHPESLSDTDVEMLKAQNAEEAALAGQAQDEELQHFGFQAGLGDSPWLAGQRSQNAWDRRSATIGSNRTVDIAAANQRQSDRHAAATLGQQFAQYRTAKGQQALNIAVEGALGKASEQRGRKALNESMKQAATQLGLSRDQLVLGYITNNLSFLRDNKSLDLGYDVDIKKLAEQSDEFKQTLAQRIAEMKQNDDQFKANYGLALQEFGHRKDQDYWERAKSAAG